MRIRSGRPGARGDNPHPFSARHFAAALRRREVEDALLDLPQRLDRMEAELACLRAMLERRANGNNAVAAVFGPTAGSAPGSQLQDAR